MLKLFVGVPILLAVVNVLAQASDGGSSDPNPWVQVLQWGPPGVVLVLLGTGQLRFNREVKDKEAACAAATARAEKAEAWKDEQQKYNQEKVIPLLADTSRTLVEVGRVLQVAPVPATTGGQVNEQAALLREVLSEIRSQRDTPQK